MYYRNLTETISIINIPQVLHYKSKVYFKTSLTPTCESVNLSVLGAGAGVGVVAVVYVCGRTCSGQTSTRCSNSTSMFTMAEICGHIFLCFCALLSVYLIVRCCCILCFCVSVPYSLCISLCGVAVFYVSVFLCLTLCVSHCEVLQ